MDLLERDESLAVLHDAVRAAAVDANHAIAVPVNDTIVTFLIQHFALLGGRRIL